MRPHRAIVLGICLFFAVAASAQSRDYFLPTPATRTYMVILAGASPEKAYGDQIRRWCFQLYTILTEDYGYRRDHIILLMNRSTDSEDGRISGASRRDILYEKMEALRDALHPGDQLFFFLIGHGTSDAADAKFVLSGPDISGREFAVMLRHFSAQDIVVVNAASSSLPFCKALIGPGRVLVSATRSRAEKYNTIFAQYFIAALDDHAGDRDKNRRVSIWEAFHFAATKVKGWYADQNRIPTEHAALEDNGDGIFSLDPGPGQADGRLAQVAYIDPLVTAPAALPPGDAGSALTLNAKIRELERSVLLLRHRKADLPAQAYQQEMEQLLIELARTSRQLRQMSDASRR
ncbi:MAG: hypothetical protein QNJ22_15075 [Desulfosarcinaceae bacterium]|nr:hypothetical protein [Desulfosarcinaceae bacterium]